MSNINSAARSQAQPDVTAGAPAGCCGGPAPQGAEACCVRDAEAKATGGAGCGCGAPRPAPATRERTRSGCC